MSIELHTEEKSTYMVKIEFTPEGIEQIRNGIPIDYKCPFAPDIIIRVYKEPPEFDVDEYMAKCAMTEDYKCIQ